MSSPIIKTEELGFPWVGLDPFLMTVHHIDHYPAGNDRLGPVETLDGRRIGSDFSYLNGWSMYHGDLVPGFPQHPHRGFETVTVVKKWLCGSLRLAGGDGQIRRRGRAMADHRIGHPALRDVPISSTENGHNPLELFPDLAQPPARVEDGARLLLDAVERGHPDRSQAPPASAVDVMAGEIDGIRPPAPPPDSWASRLDSHLGIWLIRLDPGAAWDLPKAPARVNRMLHCIAGDDVRIAGTVVSRRYRRPGTPRRQRLLSRTRAPPPNSCSSRALRSVPPSSRWDRSL